MYSPMMSEVVNARMSDRRRAETRPVARPRDSRGALHSGSGLRTLSTLAGLAVASAVAVLVRAAS